MPCTAPSRNNLRVQGPCGYETYAAGLCKPHYQLKNGLIVPGAVDQYTVLLLHGEALVDAAGHPITAVGNAGISSAQSVFGGSSLAFDGAGDVLTSPDSPDFAFGAGDWTVDFWVRFNDVATLQWIVAKRPGSGFGPWSIVLSSGFIRVLGSVGGTAWDVATSGGSVLVVSTWYHVAVVRSVNDYKVFLNGSQYGPTATVAGALMADSTPLSVGAAVAASSSVNGWLDEVRISKGIARWTAPFSPPTAPY